MNAPHTNDYLEVGIYEFKNNLSRYIRLLENGDRKGIILHRHGARVGAFIPFNRPKKRAKNSGRRGPVFTSAARFMI